jgi:hypothetical protein
MYGCTHIGSQEVPITIECNLFGLNIKIPFVLHSSNVDTVVPIIGFGITGALAVTYMITGYFLCRMMMMMMMKKWIS